MGGKGAFYQSTWGGTLAIFSFGIAITLKSLKLVHAKWVHTHKLFKTYMGPKLLQILLLGAMVQKRYTNGVKAHMLMGLVWEQEALMG